MGELKSAWEIAQEKADKLGKLSVEEEQQQREEECRQIGTAVAQKYFDQPDLQDIATVLNSYPEEKRKLIRRATLNCLVEAIDLTSLNLGKAIQGIAMVEPRSQGVLEQIAQLAQEYEQAGRKAREGLQNKVKETLHQLRISGTAVDINIETTLEWQEAWSSLAQPFKSRLDTLKQELTSVFRH